MDYLVSVVVPTKNRYKYLKNLIRLIDGFHLDELELVIQDNSDDNTEILEYLKNYSNGNIHYYYSTDKLTMSTNADAGIRNAKGEYVCYIGDDDGVCKNIVECVRWMKNNRIDGIKSSQVIFHYNEELEQPSRLSIVNKGCVAHIEDPMSLLRQANRRGLILADSHIPMVYQSIIKKTVLDRVYERGGTHFPGVVPDVSGGVCICFELKKYAVIGMPVVINGLSKNAAGGVFTKDKNGILKLEDVSFITQQARDEWDKRLPRLWYGSSVWTNAGIKALEYMGAKDMAANVNIEYSLARALRFYPWLKKELLKYSNNHLSLYYWVVWQVIRRYWNAIVRRTIKRNESQAKLGLSGIEDCASFIEEIAPVNSFSNLKVK